VLTLKHPCDLDKYISTDVLSVTTQITTNFISLQPDIILHSTEHGNIRVYVFAGVISVTDTYEYMVQILSLCQEIMVDTFGVVEASRFCL
jgi:hypothetical protein